MIGFLFFITHSTEIIQSPTSSPDITYNRNFIASVKKAAEDRLRFFEGKPHNEKENPNTVDRVLNFYQSTYRNLIALCPEPNDKFFEKRMALFVYALKRIQREHEEEDPPEERDYVKNILSKIPVKFKDSDLLKFIDRTMNFGANSDGSRVFSITEHDLLEMEQKLYDMYQKLESWVKEIEDPTKMVTDLKFLDQQFQALVERHRYTMVVLNRLLNSRQEEKAIVRGWRRHIHSTEKKHESAKEV